MTGVQRVPRIEIVRVTVSPDNACAARALRRADEEVEELVALAREDKQPGW